MTGTALQGSTVLVTGGGSGIGRLMAIGAARRSARVVIWDRDGGRAEQVRDEIGDQATAFTVDVTDKQAVRATADATGPIDVLVNNAGVVSGQRLLDATEEGIERTFAVNVLALFWVTRAFLPGMVERDRGSVVTIASAAGLIGVAQQTDYSSSKHAAIGFDESLRAELRTMHSHVKTMVVCPYYIDTGMFAGVRTRVPWLLPILKEQRVADTVLAGIEKGRRRVVLPPLVGLVPALRILPVPVFDAAADLLGVNQSMAHFTGRPGDVVGH
jgi:all-trans-retinol dehydrogenase (NAD+)